MKIAITYNLMTDGDFSLNNPEKFSCHTVGTELYTGDVDWEASDFFDVAIPAKEFLAEFLCDGLHVGSSHYWLLGWFYAMIEKLIDFIERHEAGTWTEWLSGNYDGTFIQVTVIK